MTKEKKLSPCPEFGVYLRELRKAGGFTQESFAGAAGFDRTYISGVERGERNVSLINICRFADTLKVHPADLFEFYKSSESTDS